MPTLDVLAPFAVASLVLAVLPGPNVVFLLARGAQYGGWSAWRSAVGVETATLVLGFATAFGVGALIAASAVAFQVLKWAGVAYLCWLGLRTLRAQTADDMAGSSSPPPMESVRREAMRGFVVGVTNPKVALFLVAFLPQFVRPGASAMSQMVVLTVVFAAVGLACDALWCLAGSGLRQLLRRRLARHRLQRRVPAVAYFGLAGWLATTGHRLRSA
jgi:threonine/homoserine/homoserine lactone efflux protein